MLVNKYIITIDNLSLHIGSSRVLHDVSLCCDDKIAIIGDNGSGKTSLLRCIYRYYQPKRGLIQLNGKDIFTIPKREYAEIVSALSSAIDGYFDFYVHEIVSMDITACANGMKYACEDQQDYYDKIKNYLGLYSLWQRNFNHLSSGEKQRVMLARALWRQPKFLLLDEPTCYLDSYYRQNLLVLLSSLNINMLITTHDSYTVDQLCNQVIRLHHGKIDSVFDYTNSNINGQSVYASSRKL